MASEVSQTTDEPRTDQTEQLFPGLNEMKGGADTCRVEWSDCTSRETTITASASFAREFNDRATVTEVTDK